MAGLDLIKSNQTRQTRKKTCGCKYKQVEGQTIGKEVSMWNDYGQILRYRHILGLFLTSNITEQNLE